ncbi:DUF397 domain-containing protein [Embleya sp. AB8]|uniref:DUF397 domain-containing protein n=1 Tax=Embleya sp. AB8 TaxID=3156304 RepID=UPI003C78FD67
MNLPGDTRTPPVWRKSSHSHNDGDCVETAPTAMAVVVRDSKDLAVGNFAVSRQSWARLMEALKA